MYPVIPASNQDGRQAKNRKKGDEILKKSSPLKLLSQFQPNFSEMIPRRSPFKIVSLNAVLYPRWPPLSSFRGEDIFFNFIPPFF
jgi:hypothetical protein